MQTFKKLSIFVFLLGALALCIGWCLLQKKTAPKAQHIINCNNARRIYEQCVEFEKDYLELPSEESAADDPEMATFDLSSSNGYLGQLVIAAAMDSEQIFFIKGSSNCVGENPDNIVTPRSEVLKPGENGWAYFKGREMSKDASKALLVPGWDSGDKDWDSELWQAGVPVLRVDGSVILYQAPEDGEHEDYETKVEAIPLDRNDPNLMQPSKP